MYLARIVRSAAGELRAVARGSTRTHQRLRDSVVVVAVATIGLDLICAVLAYIFEHGAKQTQINSFGSAIFWTSTQLLTVSSNIQNPISAAGRILDVVMEICAISVIATLAGSMGAFLVQRVRELEQAGGAHREH